MPESFELIFWGIILATLWLRGLRRAAQRHREAAENEDLSHEETGIEVESGPSRTPHQREQPNRSTPRKVAPGLPRPVPLAERGRALRDQWTGMARQIERQMQEAAGEGRPGSFVAHVEDDDFDETAFRAGRKVLQEGGQSILTTPPAQGSQAVTASQRGVGSYQQSGAGRTRIRSSRSDEIRAFGYFDRYPPLQRAILLAEILGPPMALRDDERDLRFNR